MTWDQTQGTMKKRDATTEAAQQQLVSSLLWHAVLQGGGFLWIDALLTTQTNDIQQLRNRLVCGLVGSPATGAAP